ncbi:unnamed protein product [Tenebrio molitor]|jgi:hypothetical protein|nr:unnamed protein product [Tenebrio molitor]
MDPEIINEPGIPNQPDLPEHGDFQMPPLEELLKALEGMDGLSEENKQELRESLISRANQENPDFFANHVETAKNAGMAPDLLVLFLLLAIVVLIFVFFGYKLYKSLADRERRKEEKRRQKQQKKKK